MNTLRKLFLSFSIMSYLLVGAALTPLQAAAGESISINCDELTGKAGLTSNPCAAKANTVISRLILIIFVVASLLAFFFLIYGGIKYILSGGNKDGTAAARGMIIAAVVGLVLVFLSFLIMKIVGTVIVVDLFNLTIPSLF